MTEITRPAPTRVSDLLRNVVESQGFSLTITAVIIINALTLGLETSPQAMAVAGPYLLALDSVRSTQTVFVLDEWRADPVATALAGG